MTRVTIQSNPVASNVQQYDKTHDVTEYNHRISANIGFDTASFKMYDSRDVLEDFFFYGLGRRVTRYSDDGHLVCWDGQIVEMTLNEPGLQINISLKNMFNRVSVRYIPIDTTANPPTESAETSTAVVNNTDSQGKYGIKELVFRPPHIDRMVAADASNLGNIILEQYKEPRRSTQLTSSNSEPSLVCSCEGYFHTLGWRKYNQTGSSGQADTETLIGTIVSSVGQFVSYSDLGGSTGVTAQQYFNRDDTAFDIIQMLASLGDTGSNRWVASVYEDRKLTFTQCFDINSNAFDYSRRLSDPALRVTTFDGRIVEPWEIRANKWIKIVDLYPYILTPTRLPVDYRAIYIESVSWREPDGLDIQGSTGDKLQVILARQANQGDTVL